jgi:hypothetical protein
VITYHCFHAHCQGKTWADVRQTISGADPVFRFQEGYVDHEEPKVSPHKRGVGQTLTQILSQPERPEAYLTKPILSRGDKGFVVSSYKIGKTLFLIHWTLALATATPFLGMEIQEPAKVLYCRFELKESRFTKRLRLMIEALGGMEQVKREPVFELVRGFDITRQDDFKWLLNLIRVHNPDVLFLDPFYKLTSFDIKETSSAMPLIRCWDRIMEPNPHLAIVTAHHLRKQVGDTKDSWDQTYGPMFFFADMDFEIRLRAEHRKDPIFVFNFISNDLPVDPFEFKRNPETLLYYIPTKESDQEKVELNKDPILAFIKETSPIKGKLEEFMMTLHLSRRETKTIINQFETDGLIKFEGKKKSSKGRYFLP